MGPHYLDRLFAPRAVAVFGASDSADRVGAVVFRNLSAGGFGGKLYAINPGCKRVQDRIVVADEWRHRGIGFQLMSRLMDVASSRDLETMKSKVLAENTGMLVLAVKPGFTTAPGEDSRGIQFGSCRL